MILPSGNKRGREVRMVIRKNRWVLHSALVLWAIVCMMAYWLNTVNIETMRNGKSFFSARQAVASAAEFMQSLTYRDFKWKKEE
jgi:uncharacterized membrane protein (DUF4010 family)